MFLALPFKLIFNSSKKKEPRDELIIDMPKKKVYCVYLLIFPSMCDVLATILDCIGLIYVKINNFIEEINKFLLILNLDTCFCSSNVEKFYGHFYM